MKKVPPTHPVGWSQFGEFLFACREADPGYYVLDYLRQSGYKPEQLKRFSVAWCSFYNLGIAAKASELRNQHFYEYLRKVYPTATRASERRHFRGAAGLKAIDQWQAKWPNPEKLADHIIADNMGAIRNRCADVAQMGDYFKWKWGDLSEVLSQKPVLFRGFENVSPKVPQQGAALIAKESDREDWSTERVYRAIAKTMADKGVTSPYAPWREFDVQDAETICCVYKQYRSGGYVPGLRTAKAAMRLSKDSEGCKTAVDALTMLLANQPVKMFRKMDKLAKIVEGELRLDVTEFT